MDNVPVHMNGQTGRNTGRPNDSDRRGKLKKLNLKMVAIASGVVLTVAILVLGGLFLYSSSTGSNIDSSRYQAVFFTNGQVYFGKLKTLNSEYMKLTDIFYLQAKTVDSTNPQETTAQGASDVELIKLGSEIHGPDDEMIISKNQILFFENLKKDSKVSSSIAQFKKQ